MATTDTVCTLVPYFEVAEGRLDDFRACIPDFVERTAREAGCVHYAFSFDGHAAHCREGYDDAAAVLAHLENVGPVLARALQCAKLVRLEVHGPAAEIDRLRAPLAQLNPRFFVLEPGGLRR